MNKELIKKYKAEFEYWLNVGKLQAKFVYNQWVEAPKDIFSYNMVNFVLVIDDEYVEFRKALAEGKTIQHISATTGELIDFNKGFEPTPSYTFLATPEYYRIKLEEPTFKVGDWARAPSECIYQINETNILHGTEHFTPWKPKPGEWCWFHKGTVESLYFYKFHSIISEGYIADIPKDIEHIMTAQIFKYCEPFTGNLPTIIKDN